MSSERIPIEKQIAAEREYLREYAKNNTILLCQHPGADYGEDATLSVHHDSKALPKKGIVLLIYPNGCEAIITSVSEDRKTFTVKPVATSFRVPELQEKGEALITGQIVGL